MSEMGPSAWPDSGPLASETNFLSVASTRETEAQRDPGVAPCAELAEGAELAEEAGEGRKNVNAVAGSAEIRAVEHFNENPNVSDDHVHTEGGKVDMPCPEDAPGLSGVGSNALRSRESTESCVDCPRRREADVREDERLTMDEPSPEDAHANVGSGDRTESCVDADVEDVEGAASDAAPAESAAAPPEDSAPEAGSADEKKRWRQNSPQPFARRLRLHMDACAGTNKSQFCFGGLALLVSLGILDSVWICFMLPGHTKFAPDLVARAIAGVYNKSDVYNIAMLLECAQSCSSAQVYDAHTMYHWKEATKDLFGAIDNVMSYRQFFILPDLADVDVGESVALPEGMRPFPGRVSPLRSDVSLQSAAKTLFVRSLKRISRECLTGTYMSGVGAGSIEGGPARLHPDSVSSFLRVRLFMRRTESEPVWREQVTWMKNGLTLQDFNESLKNLRPYADTPHMGREHYGKKLSGIAEQYARYVPPQFVPDNESLPSGGMTAGMGIQQSRQSHMSDHFNTTQTASGAGAVADTAPKSMRWSSASHKPVLTEILRKEFAWSLPKSSDVPRLVTLMQNQSPAPSGFSWDGGKLRLRAREILSHPPQVQSSTMQPALTQAEPESG